MSGKPSGIITVLVAIVIEAYRPIIELAGEALAKVDETARDTIEGKEGEQ